MLARLQLRLKSQLEQKGADILRGDCGKVEMLLYLDKKKKKIVDWGISVGG